jgi:hypothetical protein
MTRLPLALPLGFLLASALPPAAQAPDPFSPDVMIAFLGDQGLGGNSEAVLALIRDEGADAVIHAGDFDYEDDPPAWDAQIDAFLGPDFPYFASAGNHDQGQFYDAGGYQDLLEARMNRLGIPWEGDLGVRSSFHFEDILIVFTAPGSYGNGDEVFAPYLRDVLAADDSVWSISAWHKNMRRMQVGGKSNETGWDVYEESRRGGAIIATAHEHSYSRTHLMADFEKQVVASTGSPLLLAADDPATPEDEGRSFAFVSGLGGHSIRNQETGGPWWASVYTSDQGARPGALFGIFNYEGDPNLARFYFKDIGGRVVDDFFVTSSLVPAPPSLRIEDVAVAEGDSGSSEAVLRATLLNATGDEVSVDYATVDGDATAGVDYEGTAGHLVFSGDVTEQSVTVSIMGDESGEGEESFFVELLAPEGAIVTRARGEVVIVDDDAPPAPLLLEVGTQGPGHVTLDPPGGLYLPGTLVWLTAVAAPGHVFAGWEGELSGVQNPATVLVDRDRQVDARFVALEPALLQVESGAAENANSVSTTAPLLPADGQLYVAAIAFKPDVAVTGVTGLGLAWSPVRAQCAGRGQTGLAVWQARGEPTVAGLVTATFSQTPSASVLAVSRYDGVGAIDPLRGVSANSVGIAGACTGGSDGDAYALELDTATSNSVVYVAAAPRHIAHLPGPGFVERVALVAGGTGSAAGISVADARAGALGPFSVTGAFGADVDWAVVAVEIPVATPFFLTVEPSPGGSIRADPYLGAHVPGTPVELTALPDGEHRFAGWSGDLAGEQNPSTLTMDSDKLVGASFVPQFRVDPMAASGGSITLDPPGGLYDAGTTVALTAVPDAKHRFTGWGGALTGLQNPASLAVDGNAVVSAGFVQLFDLSVSSGPGGSVALDPPSGPYADGSSVTLTALPQANYRFGSWSGVVAGAGNPAVLVIEADETVTATFVLQPTLSVTPAEGGSVTLDPPGGRYDQGTSVTVTAVPAPRHRFAGWSGALSGSANPATVVVDADRTIGASFVPQVTLGVAAPPGGSVALDPPGGLYDLGTTVRLTATPDAGAIFAGWNRDLSGATNPADVVVDRDLRIRAHFLIPVSLEQLESGMSGSGGSVSTAGTLVAVDDHLYLAAIASRPNVAVTGVSGLGLAWSEVGQQCAGRNQTGVALWQARGHPVGDGVVEATFSEPAQNAVLAVTRYANAGALRSAAAMFANTIGVAGPCDGGVDQDAYAHALDTGAPGGLLYVATADRNRDHLPGSGYTERIELHKGSGGSVAGLAISDRRIGAAGLTAVEGSFSGVVDWALLAIEIPAAAPPPEGDSRHLRR